MAGIVTISLTIDRNRKNTIYAFCREQRLKVDKFLQEAAENEIERIIIKESKAVFKNYAKRKKNAAEFPELY